MMAPRAYTDVMVQLGRNALNSEWSSGPSDTLTPADILDGITGPSIFSWMFGIVQTYGNVSAFLFGLFVVGRFGTWATGVLLRVFGRDERVRSWRQRVLGGCLPSYVTWFGGLARKKRRRSRAEELEIHRKAQDDLELAQFRLEAATAPHRLVRPLALNAPMPPPRPWMPVNQSRAYLLDEGSRTGARSGFHTPGEGSTHRYNPLWHPYDRPNTQNRPTSQGSSRAAGSGRSGQRSQSRITDQEVAAITGIMISPRVIRRNTTTPIVALTDLTPEQILDTMRTIKQTQALSSEQTMSLDQFITSTDQLVRLFASFTVDSDHSELEQLKARVQALRQGMLTRPDIFPTMAHPGSTLQLYGGPP